MFTNIFQDFIYAGVRIFMTSNRESCYNVRCTKKRLDSGWRNLYMKRFDVYIIIAVVVITGFLFTMFVLQPTDHLEVVISLKGEEYARIPMDGQEHVYEIETELGYNKVIVDTNGVHIEEADCPDHDCIEIGTLKRVGQSIICAPHYLVIEIVGSGEAELDGMAI